MKCNTYNNSQINTHLASRLQHQTIDRYDSKWQIKMLKPVDEWNMFPSADAGIKYLFQILPHHTETSIIIGTKPVYNFQ